MRLSDFTDQHHFMVALGRLHFPGDAPPSPERERELRAFKTLMHPNLMGTSFKVLGLEKSVPAGAGLLSGFLYGNRSRDALGI